MFTEIRRKDRLMSEEQISHLLEQGEYGFLSMYGVNGYGYGIPISFVKEEDHLYFHCATE